MIIVVSQIEQGKPRFDMPLPKSIASGNIHLPKILARQARNITAIGLPCPNGIKLSKETGGVIKENEKIGLVERSADLALPGRAHAGGNVWNLRISRGISQPVTGAHRPDIAQ